MIILQLNDESSSVGVCVVCEDWLCLTVQCWLVPVALSCRHCVSSLPSLWRPYNLHCCHKHNRNSDIESNQGPDPSQQGTKLWLLDKYFTSLSP